MPKYPDRTHIRWTGTEIACCDGNMRIPMSEPEHTRVDLDAAGLCEDCVKEVRFRRRTKKGYGTLDAATDPVF